MKRRRPDDWLYDQSHDPTEGAPIGLIIVAFILVVIGAMVAACKPQRDPNRPCGHVIQGALMCAVDGQGGCTRVLVVHADPRADVATVQYKDYAQPVETACANLW